MAHIVVSASHEESAGRSYLEGFAAGIPSIGTSVGGTPEIIKDGVNGRLVKDSDPAALAEAILELSADPEARRRMGEEGRRYLECLPAWDAISDWVAGEYVNIWKGMTKKKGPG
jgi:glycosyltransferase involved in cell wall biosynthesis